MKLLLVALLATSFVFGGDVDRVKSIVEQIQELRADSQDCPVGEKQTVSLEKDTKEIKNLKRQLKSEEKKSATLNAKLDSSQKLNKQFAKGSDKVLKDKEGEISSLKKKYEEKIKLKEKKISSLKNTIDSKETITVPKASVAGKIDFANAGTYRMRVDANVYDAIDGKRVEAWEQETSFTSTTQKNGWVKITGYFVDKQWRKAQRDLWVKEASAIKR